MVDRTRYLRGDAAGHKDQGAGKDAAAAFEAKLGRRQAEVFTALSLHGPCTVDYIAEIIRRPPHSTRPRIGELCRKGVVVKLEERGQSAFGSRQHIHRIATSEERALFAARKEVQAEKTGGDE